MIHNLSEKQKTIFQIIKNTLENSGSAPTVRELMSEIGAKSPRTISHHLKCLEQKGFINRTGENKRNIIIIASDSDNPLANLIKVPLVGWTAAGEAIFSEENVLEWIPISSRFFRLPSDEIFLLKVKGHSMAPKIENGDLVVVRKQYTAEVGQTIVALIGDQTTVKKYIPREDHIVLQPINPDFEPIVVFPDELRIQGIVSGIVKYYQ